MRILLVLLLLIFSILAFATLSTATSESTPEVGYNPGASGLAPQAVSGASQAADGVILVDRGDDPAELLACDTAVPNDCPLRSAIALANSSATPALIAFADHYRIVLQRPLPPLTANNLTISTTPNQEVHVNANGTAGSVFYVLGAHVTLAGLRLYGAGAGYATITVGGAAYDVTIANNVIGDDDAPAGNCGLSEQAFGGIYVEPRSENLPTTRAWIFGNIIECHGGAPGTGIRVLSDGVVIGRNQRGEVGPAQRNEIRHNRGVGLDLGSSGGNIVTNTHIHDNAGGTVVMNNFNNDFMQNEVE